jgi:hypothetical protein
MNALMPTAKSLAWGAAKSLPYLNITICEKCDKQVINRLNMLASWNYLTITCTFLQKI